MNIHDSMKFAVFLGPGAIQTDKYSVEDPSDKPMRAGGPGSGRKPEGGRQPLTPKKEWRGHSKKQVLDAEDKAVKTAQMTRAQYTKSRVGTEYTDFLGRPQVHSGKDHEVRNDGYYHQAMVKWALNHGMKVPSRVLKDYPDIDKQSSADDAEDHLSPSSE